MYGTVAQDGSRAGSAAHEPQATQNRTRQTPVTRLAVMPSSCVPRLLLGVAVAATMAVVAFLALANHGAKRTAPPPCPLSGKKAAAAVTAAGPAATQGRQRAVRGGRPPLLLPLPAPALGTSRHPPGRRAVTWSAKSVLIKVREAIGGRPGAVCEWLLLPFTHTTAAGDHSRQALPAVGIRHNRCFAPLQAP